MNVSTRFHKGAFVAALALFALLLAAGCDNTGNPFKRGDQQCVITPQLKKILKDYDVIDVRNDLMVVGARTPMVDETGRSFYPQGCIDMNGGVVIPIQYVHVGVADGLVFVSKNTSLGGRCGLFDLKGNKILPIEYEDIFLPHLSSHNYLIVKKNGLSGVVDKNGKVVIPLQYDFINLFYGYLAYKKYTKEQIPDIFLAFKNKDERPEVFNLSPEKMATKPVTPYDVTLVEENGTFNFMDYKGHIVAGPFPNVRKCGDTDTPLFPEGLAAVVKNNKVGFIDDKGIVRIPFEFEYREFDFGISNLATYMFSEDLCAVMKGGKWGYIDKQGNMKIPFEYDCAYRFHQGSAIVGKLIGNKTWHGLIDKNGAIILPLEFESGVYSGNVYVMCQNGKWGVYSPEGECLVPCQYEQSIVFYKGYANVMLNGKQGLMDEQGRILIPCEYESVLYDEAANLVYVKRNGKDGYVDLRNNAVVPIKFDWVDWIGDGFFRVSKNGRHGLYDRCGNCTLD